MSTRTGSFAPSNSTDALFRLWINEIHNSLIAFGWVQTSDTGQINFSTVTRPTTTSTYQGYAIYRMGDSLQSTCAFYMRLDFGTGGGTDNCSIKFRGTIGGTDGAGTLTGNTTATITMAGSQTASVTPFTTRASGSSSSFRMSFWGTVTGSDALVLMIERDRDVSGAETSLGINILWGYQSGSTAFAKGSQYLELAGGTGPQEASWYGLISSQTSQSGAGVVGIGPCRCSLGPLKNPMLSAFIASRTDFTMETTYPVTIYGASHTYLIQRPLVATAIGLNGLNTDTAFGMQWE